jgi:hypothetical protein
MNGFAIEDMLIPASPAKDTICKATTPRGYRNAAKPASGMTLLFKRAQDNCQQANNKLRPLPILPDLTLP